MISFIYALCIEPDFQDPLIVSIDPTTMGIYEPMDLMEPTTTTSHDDPCDKPGYHGQVDTDR